MLFRSGRIGDDGDVAIMMVEAGGTENSWPAFEAGAPKVTEEVIAEGLEASKTWIRDSVLMQRELAELAGVKPPMEYSVVADYSTEVYEAVAEVGTDRVVADSSKPYAARIEQIFAPSLDLQRTVSAHVMLTARPAPPR